MPLGLWQRPAQSPPVAPLAQAADPAAAFAAARRQDSPVVVNSLMTPTRKVSAQPNGTLTAEVSMTPVRVRRGADWVPVDTALVASPSGAASPTRAASTAPSAGPATARTAVSSAVSSAHRAAPAAPRAAVSPARALAPRAAQTPLAFSGGGSGTPLVRYGSAGRSFALSWPGALPVPVLHGATAVYRDVVPGADLELTAEADGFVQHLVVRTARAAHDPALSRIRLGLTTDGLALKADATGAVQARDHAGHVVFSTPPSAMWDSSGTRASHAAVRLDRTSLTLVPDRALLTDPHAVFPVVVDPDWRTFDRNDWTKVFSGSADSGHWYGAGDTDSWGKVGTCVGWAGCGGVDVARTYWQFDTSFLAGKRVLSAELDATIVYGPQCNTRDYDLFAANATIDAGTTWNNAPGGWLLDTSPGDSAYTGCAGNKGIGFSVMNGLNTTGWSAYFMKAHDEGDKYAWRKLDAPATKVVVNYNTRPNPPYEMTTQPPLKACKWCGGTPYVGDDTIRLQGRLSDPDNDQLKAVWDVYGGPSTEHHEGPTLISGSVFTTDVDLRNRDGQTVSWTLWGSDGPDGGDWKNGPGPFVVDRVGISTAPGVTGVLYQEDNRWHGGKGVPGSFTFDAAGVADVDHYLYGWSDPPATQADADALGGRATVSIAPPADGPQNLYVQSVDRAGHRSPTKTLHLYVRAGNGPVAQWSLDGNAKDSAYLGDRDGTLQGGAGYTQGAVGSAVQLDGTTGYVTAPNAVRTDASMSVSAWAKVTSGGTAQSVVSQDGAAFAGFDLEYRPENGGRWAFAMPDPNSADKAAGFAWSASPAQLGVWTHLTGVYDAAAGQIRLYVNGVLSATNSRPVAVNATGPLRIGRAQWDSDVTRDHLGGAVDEVTVYDRALTAAEISAAVSRDNVQVGYWPLDETGGATAADSVPGGAAGVLQGGAHFTHDGGAVNGAVQLDAATDYVSTGAPVVHTDQSFTVSAWARLDTAPGGTGAATVLSQEGSVNSAYFLEYRSDPGGDMWELYTTSADAADRSGDSMVRSKPVARTGEWTQLTAVYDAPAGQIRLYVDGEPAGSAARSGGFDAAGPMLFGRGRWNGTPTNFWNGAVDEVRAYSRVLSADEIRGLVTQDGVPQGQWKLDGNLQDAASPAHDGTAINAPDYTGGQSAMPDPADLAVRLNGTTQAVSAAHVIDVDRSFSVAAWARVEQTGALETVLSQEGANDSAFKLRARPDGRWGFVMFAADTPDDGSERDEVTGGAVQVGQWAHLVAVYDAGAHQLRLYVDGALVGTVAHTQTYDVTGGLQIGRAKWAGAPVEYFPGSVDDVAVYQRALFASEIQTMAGRDLSLVHEYRLDETGGHNAADAAGARTGTVAGAANFGPGRVGDAVTTDGSTGAVTTGGVDLRLDQAFTVSAWVKLASKDCDLSAVAACRADAVSVDGAHTSKFRLGHVVDFDENQFGAWTFEMPESDADGAAVTKAAVSTLPTEVNTWTHLVGVYDPSVKKLWLYVNGTRVGDGTLNSPWQPGGGLAIGRGKAGGAAAEFWPGSVDDVRLYTGQLDKDRVSALYRSYPAMTAAALPTADAARWTFDENTGTTAADSSARDMTAKLQGGSSWIGGRSGYAVSFDGTTGYAETAGPVVDTGSSFSASAWAYLHSTGKDNSTVLAQDGNRLSSFILGYNGAVGKWTVTLPMADKDDPGSSVVNLNSTEAAVAGAWTHLTVSYDADLHQVRLYVNGLLSAAQVGVSVLPSTGPMTIGAGKWNGNRAAPLPGVVDDVRVYAKAVSDGEARLVHDDIADADLGYYRFDDGTAKDSTWRKYDAAASGGVSYVAGDGGGRALQLDGSSGALTTPSGLPMRDSFTVSAWARLDRDDKVATAVSQDGGRTSGFVLQYRPDLKRWVFGAAVSDTDGAPQVYAASTAAPALHQWTHLAGVYDYAARQLRLYVDGQPAGTRDDVVLWRATGQLVIGRGKSDGAASDYFPGALDEVRAGEGVATDASIAVRGGWSAPQPGELARFADAAGDHYTGSTDAVRDGYHFEAALGLAAAPGDDTRMLYACRSGSDGFTSQQPDCEGKTVVGDLGLVYTQPPVNIPTLPLYRCDTGADHFESRDVTCGGATDEETLGYTVAYAQLSRYMLQGFDHTTSIDGSPPGYRNEGPQGYVVLADRPGTEQLYDCRNGYDRFVSTDAACEGGTLTSVLGGVWTQPPDGTVTKALYRCRIGADSFVSLSQDCEGYTLDRLLGYTLASVPVETAVFA